MFNRVKEKVGKFRELSFKKKVVILSLFVLFLIVTFIDSKFLHNQLLGVVWIFDVISIGLLLSAILILASFAIMRSLVEVAAGLSLLIFLAQSYCNVPVRSAASNNALKGLLGVGIIYLSWYFLKTLYKVLADNYKKFDDKEWPREKTLFIVLFSIFTISLIYDIYQVVQPVILNLCVYK